MKHFKTQTSAQKLLSNRVRTAGRFSLRALFASPERRTVALLLFVVGQFFYPASVKVDAINPWILGSLSAVGVIGCLWIFCVLLKHLKRKEKKPCVF
jgi:hypothetical protein